MIYLDANVIIRLVEGTPPVRGPIEARLIGTRGLPRVLLTSRLSRLECLVLPIRTANANAILLFETFFRGRELFLHELTPHVVEKATEIRATLGFKTPDSLHLATAIVGGATVFLTGDKNLARCTEITVEVL